MTKSEKIQEAFGKSWNQLTDSMQQHILKVHPWVDRSQNRMNLSPADLGFDEKTECEVHCEFWRPVSLKGIEDNNGWIKLESEQDLPTDHGHYLTIMKSDPEEIRITKFPISKPPYHLDNGVWLRNVLYYQIINTPQLPIY